MASLLDDGIAELEQAARVIGSSLLTSALAKLKQYRAEQAPAKTTTEKWTPAPPKAK